MHIETRHVVFSIRNQKITIRFTFADQTHEYMRVDRGTVCPFTAHSVGAGAQNRIPFDNILLVGIVLNCMRVVRPFDKLKQHV